MCEAREPNRKEVVPIVVGTHTFWGKIIKICVICVPILFQPIKNKNAHISIGVFQRSLFSQNI